VQGPRLHEALIPNPSSGDNGLHRDLCQAPAYCGRKPPHAYALSISVNAFERETKENSATLVGHEGSGRFSYELVRGEHRMVGETVVVTITDKHWLLPWPVVEVRLRELVR
jgi:hypothetical protein